MKTVAPPLDLAPLGTLLKRIEAQYRPEQVWLFGSRARGNAGSRSDWDLLVVVPDDTEDTRLDPVQAWRLHKGSGVYADVIPYRQAVFDHVYESYYGEGQSKYHQGGATAPS